MELYDWQSRLGEVYISLLRFLESNGVSSNLNTCHISDYTGCKLAKFSTLPFSKSKSCSIAPFEIIHSDVWVFTKILELLLKISIQLL